MTRAEKLANYIKLNFSSSVVHPKKGVPLLHIVHYINGQFYVKIDGKLIEVAEESLRLTNIPFPNTVYSLPSNHKHDAWTRRNVNSLGKIANTAWSKVKDKQKVKGKVVNGKFVIE